MAKNCKVLLAFQRCSCYSTSMQYFIVFFCYFLRSCFHRPTYFAKKNTTSNESTRELETQKSSGTGNKINCLILLQPTR